MKNLFTFFSFLFVFVCFGQGLKFNNIEFSKSKKWEVDDKLGYSSTLPSKISYRNYTPPIMNQGEVSTCVGYALAYAQFSTQQNINMGIVNPSQKIFRAMDPNYIYSMIRDLNDDWCQKGTSMTDGLNVLMRYGCKPYLWYPWLSCSDKLTTNDFTMALASNYTISDYLTILPDEYFVKTVKQALQRKLVVSVGVELTESFMKGTTIISGNYQPKYGETFIGGHAMCIIGYDDNRNGGSFEIMNSYGRQYGDQGYIWIKYKDLKALTHEAYVLSIDGFKSGKCSFGDCANTYSRYKFDNGDVYEGMLKNNKPDVFGAYVYNNGNFFVGEFENGLRNGYGILYNASKDIYFETTYKNNLLVESSVLLGYATKQNKEKISRIIDIIKQQNLTLITENDDNYEVLLKELDNQVKEIVVK